MERVDDAYEAKMVAFEVDCNDGKGIMVYPSVLYHRSVLMII
jgi:hypothetical protein